MKTEPNVFGWDQQVANGVEPWSGVRSFQAANYMKAMEKGDQVFFYHSNIGKEIVGIVEVVRNAYQDPTDDTGRWVCVDVKTVKKLPNPVTLAAIKAEPRLEGIPLIRQSRLSVMPISPEHSAVILEMAGKA
ncbi:MAG: hypothetical protein JWR10_86 [Rubritepida sp.]|nr:hypothetical protein [Rubritepida sp.]